MGHFEALTRIALPSRREEDAIERVHARAAGHGFELRQIAWIVTALVVIAGRVFGDFSGSARTLRSWC